VCDVYPAGLHDVSHLCLWHDKPFMVVFKFVNDNSKNGGKGEMDNLPQSPQSGVLSQGVAVEVSGNNDNNHMEPENRSLTGVVVTPATGVQVNGVSSASAGRAKTSTNLPHHKPSDGALRNVRRGDGRQRNDRRPYSPKSPAAAGGRSRLLKCFTCEALFSDRDALFAHKDAVHGKSEKIAPPPGKQDFSGSGTVSKVDNAPKKETQIVTLGQATATRRPYDVFVDDVDDFTKGVKRLREWQETEDELVRIRLKLAARYDPYTIDRYVNENARLGLRVNRRLRNVLRNATSPTRFLMWLALSIMFLFEVFLVHTRNLVPFACTDTYLYNTWFVKCPYGFDPRDIFAWCFVTFLGYVIVTTVKHFVDRYLNKVDSPKLRYKACEQDAIDADVPYSIMLLACQAPKPKPGSESLSTEILFNSVRGSRLFCGAVVDDRDGRIKNWMWDAFYQRLSRESWFDRAVSLQTIPGTLFH